MRRFLFFWLLFTQLPGCFALWQAKNTAVRAAQSLPIGFSSNWPFIVWAGFGFFALLVVGLMAASWVFYGREENNVTLALTSLLLILTLPILLVGFVNYFALR